MGQAWLVSGARVVTDDAVLAPGYVLTAGDRIRAVGAGDPPPDIRSAAGVPTGGRIPTGAARALDLGGRWLAPGFLDLHVHGGGGAEFMTPDPDARRQAARFHARHGTTGLLATTVSAPPPVLAEAVRVLGASAGRPTGGARILGIHLEGPFLAPARAGAQDPRAIRDPDPAEFDRLYDAAGGWVRLLTLAPERPGALDLVRRAAARGVVPAAGHTDAGYDRVAAAVEAGLRHATHTFNAMRGLHHREPGALGAVLDLPVSCEVIADGHHVHPAAVRLLYRVKGPAATVLVTDATAAAGMPDGEYRLGPLAVRVTGGRAALPGGALAGTTLTLDAAVRNAVTILGVTPAQAVRMASAAPARVLGLGRRFGRIAPGGAADLVVLEPDLQVWGTMVAGRWVHGPPAEGPAGWA